MKLVTPAGVNGDSLPSFLSLENQLTFVNRNQYPRHLHAVRQLHRFVALIVAQLSFHCMSPLRVVSNNRTHPAFSSCFGVGDRNRELWRKKKRKTTGRNQIDESESGTLTSSFGSLAPVRLGNRDLVY